MTSNSLELLEGLPGADRITEGLRDFQHGRHTVPACLVRIARPRLIRAGLMAACPPLDDGAELELYQKLAEEGTRAHSSYNALIRELISFEHALDHRLSKQKSASISITPVS